MIKPKIMQAEIIKPIGIVLFNTILEFDWKVGIDNGAGCVKVANLVGSTVIINCAANVGSIVFVIRGVGVFGIVTIGRSPR